MAQRKRTSSRTSSDWLRFFSFVAVMLLGLALMLSFVFGQWAWGAGLSNWLKNIAIAIALIIPLFLSYYEARYRKSIVWFVLWVIAMILVIVFYVLPFIPGI